MSIQYYSDYYSINGKERDSRYTSLVIFRLHKRMSISSFDMIFIKGSIRLCVLLRVCVLETNEGHVISHVFL